jgi:hypothetical protein
VRHSEECSCIAHGLKGWEQAVEHALTEDTAAVAAFVHSEVGKRNWLQRDDESRVYSAKFQLLKPKKRQKPFNVCFQSLLSGFSSI